MSGAKKKSERRAQQAEVGMTERQKQELKASQAKRRNKILAIIGGIVAVVLVVLLLVWNSGIFSRHTTALTVGEHKLSVVDMDYYYHSAMNYYVNQEQYMAQMYASAGVEYTTTYDASLDPKDQVYDKTTGQTFHDYFKEQAKTNATQICALYDAATAAGYTLSEDAQTQLDQALEELDSSVKQYNFGSRDAYLKRIYGRNMTYGTYLDNLEMNILASDYLNTSTSKMTGYSDEELQAYYDANPGKLDSYDYDYVYFDGSAADTDADGNAIEVTDEAKAAALADAKTKADAFLAAIKAAGADTTFSAVATEQGLTASPRTGVIGTTLSSAPYAEWIMDDSRQDGDVDVFELEGTAYYVVQFHNRYLSNDPTVDVRHILASYEADETVEHQHDENGTHVYTDAEKEAAHAKAQSWLDEYNAGEKTAEAFGILAERYSGDGRNPNGEWPENVPEDQRTDAGPLGTPGGLYEKVAKGDMVKPFEDWIFDPARTEGETGLVQTDFGWHVMYFQALHRPAWMDAADKAKGEEEQTAFMENAEAGHEAQEGSGWSDVGLS